ncbi:prepilin peptidase [Virgibacillus soli]|uniref:Prepilin peptidase n=1 Tax=Paracerasibacillus soli TaxID=480284 RepID=A0ABU5CQL1_9BACI|nr:prepilin peptidase [Virgibacillus soli]MDY0408663.1 prepilin peptidase [Virgibacillus soli]
MEVWLGIYFTMIGLCFGSFFHVVGLRMPKYEKYGISRSRCPACRYNLGGQSLFQFYRLFYKKEIVKIVITPSPFLTPSLNF